MPRHDRQRLLTFERCPSTFRRVGSGGTRRRIQRLQRKPDGALCGGTIVKGMLQSVREKIKDFSRRLEKTHQNRP